jgi:hypothetical protein
MMQATHQHSTSCTTLLMVLYWLPAAILLPQKPIFIRDTYKGSGKLQGKVRQEGGGERGAESFETLV